MIATGLVVNAALKAVRELEAEGINARLINIHTIKPIDEELLVACAQKTGKVITIEEGSIVGGLGTAVCETLSEKCPVPVRRIGMFDIFGTSGEGSALLDYYGLNAEHIIDCARELCQ